MPQYYTGRLYNTITCCMRTVLMFDEIAKAQGQSITSDSYTARLTGMKPDQPRFTIIGSGS